MFYSVLLFDKESGPNCDANRSTASLGEGDYITMECFLQFRGNVAPVMKWRNEVTKQSIASQTNEKFNQHVRSTVTFNIDEINDGDSISCTIYFNQSSHYDIDSIAHAPLFEYLWTSSAIALIGTCKSYIPIFFAVASSSPQDDISLI